MKIKLHFGLFVILFAFLGTFLEQTTVPNQQIVIQFLDQDISKEEADNAIETVKAQLQTIGVALINIDQNSDGQLKITYYSASDVDKIQDLFLEAQNFEITYDTDSENTNKFPVGKSLKDYELNISEIQNSGQVNWDFEKTEIVQLDQKSDYSYNSKVNASGHTVNEKYNTNKIRVAIQIRSTIALAIDNHSCAIPEVRAGPNSNGII